MACSRRILSIKWQERTPDTQVLHKAGLQIVHNILMRSQLPWARHVSGIITKLPSGQLKANVWWAKKTILETLRRMSMRDFNSDSLT